jgi:hypothetical protein
VSGTTTAATPPPASLGAATAVAIAATAAIAAVVAVAIAAVATAIAAVATASPKTFPPDIPPQLHSTSYISSDVAVIHQPYTIHHTSAAM